MEAREATATGESCMRVDAIAKVTGRARYTDDYVMAGMCYACLFYTSPLSIFLLVVEQGSILHQIPVSYTHLDVYKRQGIALS